MYFISRWEGVYTVRGVRRGHPPHLLHPDGEAAGRVGREAGPVLVRPGDRADKATKCQAHFDGRIK